MGACCGCGGTCPMCGPILARNIRHHTQVINQEVERLAEQTVKQEEKKPKKIAKLLPFAKRK